MFKQRLSFLVISIFFITNTCLAEDLSELSGSSGRVIEIGKLMEYVVVDGTQFNMNAKTSVVSKSGLKRSRGALKVGQEIRIFYNIEESPITSKSILSKIIILGGK